MVLSQTILKYLNMAKTCFVQNFYNSILEAKKVNKVGCIITRNVSLPFFKEARQGFEVLEKVKHFLICQKFAANISKSFMWNLASGFIYSGLCEL